MTDKNHYDHLEKIMNRLADSVFGLSDEALLAGPLKLDPMHSEKLNAPAHCFNGR